MRKQKNEKNQYLEMKQDQTNCQKFTSTLYRFFIRQQNQSPEINQAIVTASYFQIFSLINIIILFTLFSNTNSQIYSIIISSLTAIMIIFDALPKISKKHFVFNFVSITQGLVLIGMIISAKVLLDNYFVFIQHCQDFTIYYQNRAYLTKGPKNEILAMCSSVRYSFIAEIIVQSVFILGKFVHVCLYVRAYVQAKQKFEQDERKRRRKDRYNEMIRKKYIFNQKRRV